MMAKININGKEFEPVRLKLRGWTTLDELRLELEEAISKKDIDGYYSAMVKIIEVASIPCKVVWDEVPWQDALNAFSSCIEVNQPTINFPILEGQKKAGEKAPWEYKGRTWFYWLNLFAKNYNWNDDTISNLDIDTAIGLYQEIEIDDQLEKEFTYSLSEVAFPYNENTKKQEYRPLPRPEWMLPIVPKPKIVKIRRDLLPVGNIVDFSERDNNGDTKP